jgi:2-methylcitrate dehydratase PrpD
MLRRRQDPVGAQETGRVLKKKDSGARADEFTRRIAGEVVGITLGEIAPATLERTRHVVLDWLGVTMAGSREQSARMMREVVTADGGVPAATIVGTADRVPAEAATLANAIAAHALDFDDSSPWAGGHPSAPIVSAAVALGQAEGRPWSEILVAIVAALQGQARIAIAIGPSHYEKGFHATGTLGAFGAAAACGRLLDLDAAAMQGAFGLAATQAAGLKASFGTMGKHLNAAKAGANGLLAARLAAKGFSAPLDGVEARQGFAWTQSGTFDPDRPYEVMGEDPAINSIVFKRHACCHGTHSAIEGVKRLRTRYPLARRDVKSVRLIVPRSIPDVCGIDDPTTGLEGKFSIKYATALALNDMPTGPTSFTDELVHDPTLAALRRKIEVVPGDSTLTSPTIVVVELQGGEQLTAEVGVLDPAGDEDLDSQWAALAEKFESLVAPIVGAARATEAVEVVARLEAQDGVTQVLRGLGT